MEIALASSAVRKGLASQQNIIGDLARSYLGNFIQRFLNAQFSQEEEKAADDYALEFMQRRDYNPKMAVSSLQKLATLDNEHSFLSSHPAPQKRAERLRTRLQSPKQQPEKGIIKQIANSLWSSYFWIKKLLHNLITFITDQFNK